MSNNLVGIQYTANFNNLDGLSVIDADEIFINGQPVDLDNLVPYTGATKAIDLNSQNIQTTHYALVPADLVNLQVLTDAVTYQTNIVGANYLNKTTTSIQSVAGSANWNATQYFNAGLYSDQVLFQDSANAINLWNVYSTGGIGGGPSNLTFNNIQTSQTITFNDNGTLNATGATASRVAIWDASKNLTYSATTTTELGYLSGTTSNVQTQLNAKASITYVDTQDALKVSKSGDTMTGTLAMGANKITTSYVPTAGIDLCNKTYVDSVASGTGILTTNNSWTGNNTFSSYVFTVATTAGGYANMNGIYTNPGTTGGVSIGTGAIPASGYLTCALPSQFNNDLSISGVATVAKDQTYANRASNPFTYSAVVKTNTTSQRLYLGSYYTGGAGACSAIQASDYWSSADHGTPLLVNPLGGAVGIGTSTPLNTLTISGTGAICQEMNRTGATTNYGVGTLYTLTSATNSFRGSYARTFGGGTSIATTAQNQAQGYFAIETASGGNFPSDAGGYSACDLVVVPGGGYFKSSLGVGTTQPQYSVDVSGSLRTTGRGIFGYVAGSKMGIVVANEDSYGTTPSIQGIDSSVFPKAIAINPAGGNVGIGINNPNAQLMIYGVPSSVAGIVHVQNSSSLSSTAGQYDILQLWTENVIGNTEYMHLLGIRDSAGSDWTTTNLRFQAKVDATWMGYLQFNGTGNTGGLSFGTGLSTLSPSSVNERMRISSNGNVGIGTPAFQRLYITTSGSQNGGPYAWDSGNGMAIGCNTNPTANTMALSMNVYNPGGGTNPANYIGTITSLTPGLYWNTLQLFAANTYVYFYGTQCAYTVAGGWVNTSDEREKEDIQDLKTSSSLKRILAVKPKHYRRKYYEKDTPVPDEVKNIRCIGFLAQDLLAGSNPHAVSTWENQQVEKTEEDDGSRYGISYNDYVVHLCGAVQEQQKMITVQQEKLDALIARDEVIVEHARQLEEDLKTTKEAFESYKTQTEARLNKLASLIQQLIK